MKCFKCDNELVFNNNNPHEFKCAACDNYSISESAINSIPTLANKNWKNVLQNFVSDNQGGDPINISVDTIHTLFGF